MTGVSVSEPGVVAPVPINQGGTGQATAALALAALGGLGLVATTGLAGYVLVNGTANILTWTAPNDGAMHRIALVTELLVTSLQTGGAIQASLFDPTNVNRLRSIFAGGLAAGFNPFLAEYLVAPNQQFVLSQNSAQTAGAAQLWAELWAL